MKQSIFKNPRAFNGEIRTTIRRFFSALFIILLLPETSSAQQADADFNAYCRANFNNSTYQMFPHSWGTEHACFQGGTRQGIDLAEACFLTTGNRQFEISGARVLCSGSPERASDVTADDLGEPDFAQYCREEFTGSVYEKRAEPQGTGHYCRRSGSTGGFTLQPVDLAAACRMAWSSEVFRIDGARVFCVQAGSQTENVLGVVNPVGPDQPTNPDFPPDLPNSGPPNIPFPGPVFPGPAFPSPTADAPAPPNRSDDAIVEQACLAMPGGVWTNGTLALVDDILLDMEKKLVEPCTGPDELCANLNGSIGMEGYYSTLVIFQCHQAFIKYAEVKPIQDLSLALDEACAIEPVLNEILARVESFWGFPMPAQHYLMISEPEFHEICECKNEETDFGELVEELMQQADRDLLEEFVQ